MTFISNVLTAAGFVILSYAAWVVRQVSESTQALPKFDIYLYCGSAFALILLGQVNTLQIVPAVVSSDTKENAFVERAAHYELKSFSVRQGEYHKRAQSAANKKSKTK